MGLFDSTAKRLAEGPTVVPDADPDELLRRFSPAAYRKGDRLVLGNGVLLYGPVDVTPELAAKTGVAAGRAYYTRPGTMLKNAERPTELKELDGEWLVRGLAARLGGQSHSHRPWAPARLELSVFASEPVPADQVIAVLQPYAGDEDGRQLTVEPDDDVADAYFLISEREPKFITAFWPGRLARSRPKPPPLALGELREREPCRWILITTADMATASPEVCRFVGEAALSLAAAVHGVVIDPFGFPIGTPEDVLPG